MRTGVNKSGDTVQYINPHPNVLSMLNCGWIMDKFLPPNKKDKPDNYVDIARKSTSQGITPTGNAWFVSKIDTVENANEELESLDSFDPKTTAIIDKRFLD